MGRICIYIHGRLVDVYYTHDSDLLWADPLVRWRTRLLWASL